MSQQAEEDEQCSAECGAGFYFGGGVAVCSVIGRNRLGGGEFAGGEVTEMCTAGLRALPSSLGALQIMTTGKGKC